MCKNAVADVYIMNKEYFNDLIYDKQIKHQMNKNISEKHNISSDQATK